MTNFETLSGSGTLHGTVGICYQNILPHVDLIDYNVPQQQQPEVKTEKVPKLRKRTFHLKESTLEPY